MIELPNMTLKFEKPKDLSVDDIKLYVSEILKNVFNSGAKTVIDEYDDRWNFACPFCGDSKTDITKKRGNMYRDDFHFHCFNCGVHEGLLWFFKKFDLDVKNGLVNSFVENAKTLSGNSNFHSRPSERVSELFGTDIIDCAIPKEVFFERLNLVDIIDNRKAMSYLLGREQKDFRHFAWHPKKNLLYVLNLDADGKKVFAFQIRRFSGNGPKYLTYEMSAMYTELGLSLDPELAKRLDPLSTIFGCMSIDISKTITVFEGPLDSFLMPNSIALCSLQKRPPFMTKLTRFMFDYDKSGIDKSVQLLKESYSVFMWSKFFLDNFGLENFIDKEKVDFSDIVMFERKHNKKFDYNSYFTNNALNALCIGKTSEKKKNFKR